MKGASGIQLYFLGMSLPGSGHPEAIGPYWEWEEALAVYRRWTR